MKRQNQRLLWCFSPAVMLGTLTLEYLFVIWALIRYRTSRFGQIASLILFLLGTFQLAEYQICTREPSRAWALAGMLAITFLPPLGIYLIGLISGQLTSARISLTIGWLFVLAFSLIPNAIGQPICGGNYVILKTTPLLGQAYGIYYIGYLLWALWEGWRALRQSLAAHLRASLRWLLGGYVAFMLPTGIVYLLSPTTRAAIPSIMCGFALALAVILVTSVLPLYHNAGSKK